MFRKTIQNIETARTGYNQQVPLTGYNTERHDRYPLNQQELKIGQQVRSKNIVSGQFSQLKKVQQQNKPSELIIRQCDVSQLNNHYKKPSTSNLRQIQQPGSYYPYIGPTSTTPNSSNKKQRIQSGLNSHLRAQTYDPSYKQPLQEINFIQRQNSSRQQQSSSNSSLSQYYDQQFQMLKQFVYQTYQQQAHSVKTLKTEVKSIQVECMGQLQNFANQISKELNKQKEDVVAVNKRGIQTQRQLRHFRDGFNDFLKDNQQKIESIVLQMNGNLHKKSKTNEQFGVQLKSSTHCISGGVGTSMSMNFQNDNVSMKLYNQMSGQIQILKNQLEICKQKISLLDKDTKILQSQTKMNQQKQTQPNNNEIKVKLQLQQVQKIIIEKLSEDRKKYSLSEKLQELDLKTKDLYKVYQDMDSNIKGMNAEFTRVINGTVIKKEKMLESKLGIVEEKVNEMSEKLSLQNLQQTLRPSLLKLFEQKSSNTKFIRIREPNVQQKQKLSTKDAQNTYMIDQEGNLLDAGGNYIIQTGESGAKQKIKIDKNLIYLLQTNGIEIKAVS